MAEASDAAPRVELRAGRLHITQEVYQRLMPDCSALALLVRGGQWFLVPLRSGAGGLQIKVRNVRGDRVVESQEFFREQGLEDDHEVLFLELSGADEIGGFRLVARARTDPRAARDAEGNGARDGSQG